MAAGNDLIANPKRSRDYDNRRVVIPKGDLYTSGVVVNTAFDRRRVEIEFDVAAGQDLDHVKAVVIGSLAGLDLLLSDPAPTVLIRGLLDDGVALELRFWIRPPMRTDVLIAQDAVFTRMTHALAQAGIASALSTSRIVLRAEAEGQSHAGRRPVALLALR